MSDTADALFSLSTLPPTVERLCWISFQKLETILIEKTNRFLERYRLHVDTPEHPQEFPFAPVFIIVDEELCERQRTGNIVVVQRR